MLVSLFRNRTQCLIPSFKTMTTVAAAKTSKDDYFAAVNHIAIIVRHDIYPERALNRLNLTLTSELVYRILRVCHTTSPSRIPPVLHLGPLPAPILPHFPRIRTAHLTLAHHKLYQSMWNLRSSGI